MSPPADSPHEIRFGEFALNLHTAELRSNGSKSILQGQPFQVLTILLERPGQLVTREELKKRLWPPDTFVDFDHGLNKAVNRLREALEDSAEQPRFIETLPRRGYRFVGTVEIDFAERSGPVELETPGKKREGSGLSAEVPASAQYPSRPRAMKLALIALAVAAAILVVSRLGWRAHSSLRTTSDVNVRSLAVLPLENLSGDPSQDYFADGMTDELITNLSQIGSIRVISRTSVMQYRGVHKPLQQIARELNVDAIVEGSVVRSSGQVRISAQLILASADKHLWSQSYERDLKDVLALQREIASAIAKKVQITITPREQIRSGIERPVSPEAYESYLKGEYLLNKFTADSIRKAADYFQQAIVKDPNYPAAYTKLAGSYQILGNVNVISKRESYSKSKPLIARALELDPGFAAAHAVRGWRLLQYDLDFATAGSEFKRAVDLNPNGPEGHEGLGNYYATMGDLQESVLEMERARQLDPLALIVNSDLCTMLYFARRYDDALAQCKANLDQDPNSVRAFWAVGAVYAAKGMELEAVSAFLQAHQLAGAPPLMIAAAKTGARNSGLKGYWRALVQFVPENIANGNLEAFDVAVVYANAGDADKALPWLERAVEARCYGITYLGVNPAFDRLRSDPRYVLLLRRIGLPAAQN
jgi:TolB-like protein/DNA-binding winged helix-turn-helix (wHTH) protein/Tfp pilus assembly protein PilF